MAVPVLFVIAACMGPKALLHYIEGRQRVDYAYECPLPREAIIPESVSTMSQQTEMLTEDYLKCFCVGDNATLSRSGHHFSLKHGRTTFTVPAGQLLLLMAKRPAQSQLDSAETGGGRATQGKDPEDSEQGEPSDAEPPPSKKARRSSKTPAKVIGYAKQTLSKVEKMLKELSTLSWNRDAMDKMLAKVTSKLQVLSQYRSDLDRFQLRGNDQSIILRMTSATRQLKVLQEMLSSFRLYFRDPESTARVSLLESVTRLEKSYATAIENMQLSPAVCMEAGRKPVVC